MTTQNITIREYAILTPKPGFSSIDKSSITQSAFDWLLEERNRLSNTGVPTLVIDGVQSLKMQSFVGVLQSPCGTRIEILPKTEALAPDENQLKTVRDRVVKMILPYLGQSVQDLGISDLRLFNWPLSEFVFNQFLVELQILVRKGFQRQYLRVDEQGKFLKGRLRIVDQIRQPTSQQHQFQISHDVFSLDRPENRLIAAALNFVRQLTREDENWQIANELHHICSEVPKSQNHLDDLNAWANNRLMTGYGNIKIWTELIVKHLNPTSQVGSHQGIALLFPMEVLFESFVAHCLKQQISIELEIKTQDRTKYLCQNHLGDSIFNLRPDILVKSDGVVKYVMDSKWKLLHASERSKNYGISQNDFYQLYAYGKKHVPDTGDLVLIYPKHASFKAPLSVFEFDDTLRLWVAPFDLDREVVEFSKEMKASLRGLKLKTIPSIAS